MNLNYFYRYGLGNDKGLSLTELIVSVILISIVLVGVAGFSISLNQIDQTTGRAAVLNTQLIAAINHIKKNAFIAIGFKGDPGVVIDDTDPSTVPNYFSFRHDVTGTPIDYDNDEWIIYVLDGVAPPYTLYFCRQLTVAAGEDGPVPNVGAGEPCEPPPPIGSSSNLTLLNNINDFQYDFITSGGFYFYVNLTTCYDAATCDPSDPDHLKNPVFNIVERVSPISHSW